MSIISQITAKDLAAKINLSELRANKNNYYFLKSDPSNKNRQFLVNNNNQYITDSNLYNIKSSINEYGGGSYWLNNNIIIFYNKDDNGLYYIDIKNNYNITLLGNTKPSNIETEYNYSDGNIHNNFFVAVREVKQKHNKIIRTYQELILYHNNNIFILDKNSDFYSFPRISPSGNKIMWLSWNHPHMPWDESILYIADLDINNGKIDNIKKEIHIDNNSLFQPEWIDDNNIFIVSEHQNKYWQLFHYDIASKKFFLANQKSNIDKIEEQGLPLWQLGVNSYIFEFEKDNQSSSNIINLYYYTMHNGQSSIYSAQYDFDTKKIISKNCIKNNIYVQDRIEILGNKLYCLASDSYGELAVKSVNFKENTNKSSNVKLNPNISIAKPIEYQNTCGMKAHGFFYQPLDLASAELPALIVICHGGPTGTTNIGYNKKIQYWTQRGYAILDVNYSGSTTYGKQYRDRIERQWGVIDVDDCYHGAKYLIEQNLVNKNKIIIKGSSAGGFTVLNALYKFPDVFTIGCCYYPVTDLLSMDEHTHKYEQYYNNYLIGDVKKDKEKYIRLSPMCFADKITQPVLLFHGEDDRVINIEQSNLFFNELKKTNIKSEYYKLAGEGHGVRNPDNIEFSLNKELGFYQL